MQDARRGVARPALQRLLARPPGDGAAPLIPLPPRLRAALEPLRGRVLRLEIAEFGTGAQLTLLGPGLVPAFGRPDVTVRARLADYLALALRRADPDTLFFSRRLVILGDTALGLSIKNALDAQPW